MHLDASRTYEGAEDDPLCNVLDRLGDRVELDNGQCEGVTVYVDGKRHTFCRRRDLLDVLLEVEGA